MTTAVAGTGGNDSAGVARQPGGRAAFPVAGPGGRLRARPGGLLHTAGPAVLVSAGYVDPGNWGTDVAAGAQAGYRLVWVLAAATLAALFLQQLASRLGLASGHDLAFLIRSRLPRPVRLLVMPLILLALAVTEVVEMLGVLLGVRLLTGWPAPVVLLAGISLVLLVVLAPACVGRKLVYGCLAAVGAGYLLVLATQDLGQVGLGLRPQPLGHAELPIAIGLIGAVVMPHNVLLHASLSRDLHARLGWSAPAASGRAGMARMRSMLRASLLSTAGALAVAFAVNCAIMLLSARQGAPGAGDIAVAFGQLRSGYGAVAAALFAFTLLAAGLASSVTGGVASADVLAQFHPGLPLPAVARRLACLVPAIAVLATGMPVVPMLVWSQVLLTLALPAVLLPMLWLTCQRSVMGGHVLGLVGRLTGAGITVAILLAGWCSLR